MASRRVFRRSLASLAAAVLLAVPATSAALTFSTPKRDVLYTADFDAVMGSADPTGTVSILAGGHAYAPRASAPGGELSWRTLRLPLGSLTVVAAIRTSGGIRYSSPVRVTVWPRPAAPAIVSPSGGYGTKVSRIKVKAGAGTTRIEAFLNGEKIGGKGVSAGKVADFGRVTLPKGTSTLEFVASNPVAETSKTFKVKRIEFPWPTCIVIDKSDFKLYWVKDGELVKAYPVAHGKNGCTPEAVWRIDAKYHTAPGGIYGPRKMRLFRRTSSGKYVYTAYGIHGTNQEWVIGTMASHGCIRMYNADVLELFPQVPLGTMVQTRR